MPATFDAKLRKSGNSHIVSIPKPAVDGLNWKTGDILRIIVGDSDIRIVRVRSI